MTTNWSMKEPQAGTVSYGWSISCKTHQYHTSYEFSPWTQYNVRFPSVSSLPLLIEIVGRINVTSSICVHEFSRFFWRFCRTFGKIFTNTKVKPRRIVSIWLEQLILDCFGVFFIIIYAKLDEIVKTGNLIVAILWAGATYVNVINSCMFNYSMCW